MNLQTIQIDKIQVAGNFRQNIDPQELVELQQSISQHGLLQPLIVRLNSDDSYRLIAGERRLRACQAAGITTVPCHVLRADTEHEYAILALTENLVRSELNSVESAQAFQRILNDFGWTQQQLADALNISRSKIASAISMLESLHPTILRKVREGQISTSVAEELRGLDLLDRIATKPPCHVRNPHANGRWAWLYGLNIVCSVFPARTYREVQASIDHALAALAIKARKVIPDSLEVIEEQFFEQISDGDWSPNPLMHTAEDMSEALAPDFDQLNKADLGRLEQALKRWLGYMSSNTAQEVMR